MKIHIVPLLAVLCAGLISTLAAQQTAPSAVPPPPAAGDPFIKGGAPSAVTAQPVTVETVQLSHEGLIRLEYFSLPHTLARKMMRQFPKQQALYDWLGAELENEKSEVKLERLSLVKVRGGQRSKLEEVDEFPYPTEFDPPQIPQSIGIGLPVNLPAGTSSPNPTLPETWPPTPKPMPVPPVTPPSPVPPTPPAPAPAPAPPAPVPGAQGVPGAPGTEAPPRVVASGSQPGTRVFAPWPYTPTTANAFTFKNTGWQHEIEMTIGDDGQTVDLNLAPEFTKFVGMIPQTPSGEITQPLFETGKLTTQILTKLGRPTLVGTISPAVATGAPGGNTDNRTWLLFITVNSNR